MVSDTTPLVPQIQLDQIPILPLDAKCKGRIKKATNIDHLPEILRDKYLRMLYNFQICRLRLPSARPSGMKVKIGKTGGRTKKGQTTRKMDRPNVKKIII